MRDILVKELRLSTSVMTYLFILFGLMFFIPGYPVLCGAFFVCLGIFQSFQTLGSTNDIVFSALLPVAKKDVVKGKYLLCCLVEMCSFILMIAVTVVRMTVLSGSQVYTENVMMSANPFSLGAALFIFAVFNSVFVCGFFRTAVRFGVPFLFFTITAFVSIGIFEALHHFPGLDVLNSFNGENLGLQMILFTSFCILYVLMTCLSCAKACKNFERIDL